MTTPTEALPRIHSTGRFFGERPVPFHNHSYAELVLQITGTSEVRTPDESLQIAGAGAFCIPAGTRHDQRFILPTDGLFVVYAWRGRRFPTLPRTLALAADDPLFSWINDAVELLPASLTRGSDFPPDQEVAAALLLASLHRLAALHAHAFTTPQWPNAMQRACRHLDSHLSEPISAGDLAAIAHVSESHLRALFQRHLGCSPQHYHRDRRLALAGRLLRSSALPIADAATQCGFDDPSYFTRCFTKAHGRSPRAWRRAGNQ